MTTIRFVPSLTDEHIAQAVMTARAVVALDDRLAYAQAELQQRDEQIVEMRESAQRAEQERRKLVDRLSAVTWLHAEAQEVACADGCCHNGLGRCEYCDEPWPCRTYRVAEGQSSPEDDE